MTEDLNREQLIEAKDRIQEMIDALDRAEISGDGMITNVSTNILESQLLPLPERLSSNKDIPNPRPEPKNRADYLINTVSTEKRVLEAIERVIHKHDAKFNYTSSRVEKDLVNAIKELKL